MSLQEPRYCLFFPQNPILKKFWTITLNVAHLTTIKFHTLKKKFGRGKFQTVSESWYWICSAETKPPVWEAHRESEGQISGNMSGSMINIPAGLSFSCSVNRWTQGERRLSDRIIGGGGVLTVSFITANNETGERRSWTCPCLSVFIQVHPRLLWAERGQFWVPAWKESERSTGGVSREPSSWQRHGLCFQRTKRGRGAISFLSKDPGVRKSCESNSCCFLHPKQRPRTKWKLIRHVKPNGHRAATTCCFRETYSDTQREFDRSLDCSGYPKIFFKRK